jgi:linoleoyl-CoA desaturase
MNDSAAMQHLSTSDLERIAREFDAIARSVRDDLGDGDERYIRRVIAVQRALDIAGRGLLLGARHRPALLAAVAMLSVSKILDNMEIGHNVMHGQWDWMRDPAINSRSWEWDAVSTAKSWKRSHNYQHHTYTNVVGLDRDLGYSAIRIDASQPWHPIYLIQPIYTIAMAATFDWGMAVFDMELDAVRRGSKPWKEAKVELKAFGRKACRHVAKDFVVGPALCGRAARHALAATVAANVVRNVWLQTIVFCGHFPAGAELFTEQQVQDESRGAKYVRQLLGSCNLEGSFLFHVMTGHLSYQIEHHLFPAVPSNRYAEIAPRVREVCERFGLPYTTGPLGRQYGSAVRKVLRFALP